MYLWHQHIYQQLTEAFLQGRGHHSLLFKTEVGLGSENLIYQFAHWLLCQTKQNTEPCRQCKSCLLWATQNHPDFYLIEAINSKSISIEQIRELTEKLQQFSQQGGNIVVYIKGAELLTEAAANALLKTLEEPNDKIYFLLEAPLQVPMLATIQSRCQTWLINVPNTETAFYWLQSEFPAHSLEELEIALKLCHNRPLLCKTFLETDRLAQRKNFLQNFWRFYKSRDVWLLLREFSKEKNESLQQLEWLESFFTDSLKAKLDIFQDWQNSDLSNGITLFSQALSAAKLLKGHQILRQTTQTLKASNEVNLELMLADCLSRLVMEVWE